MSASNSRTYHVIQMKSKKLVGSDWSLVTKSWRKIGRLLTMKQHLGLKHTVFLLLCLLQLTTIFDKMILDLKELSLQFYKIPFNLETIDPLINVLGGR